MNLPELLDLTEWIDSHIRQAEIPKRYTELYQVLHNNTQPNQQQQPFEDQKENLIEALSQVPLETLSLSQEDFLNRLNILPYVGNRGTDFVSGVLVNNVIDIATAAQNIQEANQAVNAGIKRAQQIKDAVNEFVDRAHKDEYDILVRVHFEDKADINNVNDWRNWSKRWFDISRGITMAHGGSPQDIKVVGAGSGSLIIELGVGYKIALSISAILLSILEVTKRIYQIRTERERVRNLQLQNKKIEKELEDEIEHEKNSATKKIVQNVVKSVERGSKKLDGDQRKALDTAVKRLIDFVDKGGEVDCVLPQEADDEELPEKDQASLRQLRKKFSGIRQIEEDIRLLSSDRSNRASDDES